MTRGLAALAMLAALLGAPLPVSAAVNDLSEARASQPATGDATAASPTDRPTPESAEAPFPGTAASACDGEGAGPATGDDGPPTGARSASPVATDEVLRTILIFGLIGVAVVALAGTLLLVMGRLRRDAEEPAAAVAGASAETTATDDLLTRRTLQRARIRLADDPILSALGVEEEMQARRERRTRRAAIDGQTSGDA